MNPDFLNYKVPMVTELPRILEVSIIEPEKANGPEDSKGGGEVSLVVTAAAIANAIANATGRRIFDLPLNRERVFASAIAKRRAS